MEKKTMFRVVAAAVVVVLLGSSSLMADLTDGLAAYWGFDESSGSTAYDSAGNNTGTAYGGPAWTTGRIGSALDFDGSDDFVRVGANPTLDFSQSYTISAWLKPVTNPTQAMVWFGYHGGTPYGPNIKRCIVLRIYPNGVIRFGLYGDDLDTTAGLVCFGEWNHIVINYDYGTDVSAIYVNGQLKASGHNGPYFGGLRTATIGKWDVTFQSQEHFKGSMDEFKIYNRALSADEVGQLYQAGMPRLTGLEIIGPDQAAENFTTPYQAIALYEDGSAPDVTRWATWSAEPDQPASITQGCLITQEIDLPTDIIIEAQYGQGDNVQQACKSVSVFMTCPSGSALQFDDANDFVEIPSYNGIVGQTSRTCSAWIHHSDANGGTILSWGDFTANGGSWVFRVEPDGTLGIGVWGGSVKTNQCIGTGWHHVAAVMNSSEIAVVNTIELYIDGINQAVTTTNGTLPINTIGLTNVSIGVRTSSTVPSSYLKGLLDDVRIYEQALNAEEIRQLMHTKPDPASSTLAVCWDFDEGSGQVAYDVSGHGNEGILGLGPDADDSDPVWAASDAPIEICSLEGIVSRNLTEIRSSKQSILEQLYETMVQEAALLDFMNVAFRNRPYDNVSKGAFVKAKLKILGALQQEHQASRAIRQSIDKIDDAKKTLGTK